MSALKLKYYPDDCLTRVCDPCTYTWDEQLIIGNEMLAIMFANNGYGLAAPQVGLNTRLFVMRDEQNPGQGFIFGNPLIIDSSGIGVKAEEACLSLPGMKLMVERASEVQFSFVPAHPSTDPATRLTWRFQGMKARCVQHEIDHLNGIMLFDNITSKLGKKIFLQKYAKRSKSRARIG